MKCFRLFLWRKKMRTIIVVIYVFLFLILGLPVLGIEWIIAKFDKHAADISQLRIVQWGLRCVSFLAGVHLTVEGKEHVPTDQAVLYIGNHRSIFDIVITYAQCPNLTGYISKDGVNKVPLHEYGSTVVQNKIRCNICQISINTYRNLYILTENLEKRISLNLQH